MKVQPQRFVDQTTELCPGSAFMQTVNRWRFTVGPTAERRRSGAARSSCHTPFGRCSLLPSMGSARSSAPRTRWNGSRNIFGRGKNSIIAVHGVGRVAQPNMRKQRIQQIGKLCREALANPSGQKRHSLQKSLDIGIVTLRSQLARDIRDKNGKTRHPVRAKMPIRLHNSV